MEELRVLTSGGEDEEQNRMNELKKRIEASERQDETMLFSQLPR